MKHRSWKTLDSRVFDDNGYWKYKIDSFEIDEQIKGVYHYVHSPGSTLVVPFLNDETILLVHQYRYLMRDSFYEFPCGAIKDGLSPEENAQVELREETGYAAGQLSFIGKFAPYNGVADEWCHVYTAKNLNHLPLPPEETEDLYVEAFTTHQIQDLIIRGRFQDGMSLAAWCLVNTYGGSMP